MSTENNETLQELAPQILDSLKRLVAMLDLSGSPLKDTKTCTTAREVIARAEAN